MLNQQFEDKFIEEAPSLVDVLRFRAEWQGEDIAYRFLEEGEGLQSAIVYAELDRQARRLAAHLQAMGMQGERAVLLYPPGLDYIIAFFACLYAGTVAVPAYPISNNRHLQRLQTVIEDSQCASILSNQITHETLQKFAVGSDWLEKKWLISDSLPEINIGAWCMPQLNGDHLAFLQYTSGSTGNAKGVMVSHGNLMANQHSIKKRFGHDSASTVVGWLPLYHDMGLIGNVMQPLYCGSSAILMSPMAFLEKPIRWLKAISDYRAHTSGGPDFAYALCAQKIGAEEKSGLDLSHWRLAFNGSEPINPRTLALFSSAFADCGFRRQAFYPCYGLAEATLLVTGIAKHAEPKAIEDRRLVGLGTVDEMHQMRIVDPESGKVCDAPQVGEIQISGPSVTQGYWRNHEATGQAFIKEGAEKRWLRTGDLGFIEQGELFVSGRLKDLIIIRGRNFYPKDIEMAIESLGLFNPGCIAAFSIAHETGEKLIVLAELKRSALRKADYCGEFAVVRSCLVEECGIQADSILFLKPGSILKTSSGKIRRSACRQAFEQNELNAVAADGRSNRSEPLANFDKDFPAENSERGLVRCLVEKVSADSGLALESIDPMQCLTRLGLDSLKAVELKYFIDERLGIDLPLFFLLGDHSLLECAKKALQLAKADPGFWGLQESRVEAGDQPLSSGQQALWTAGLLDADACCYNMPVAMRILGNLDKAALNQALNDLIRRHSQLQSGFKLNESGQTVRFHWADLSLQLRDIRCRDAVQLDSSIQAFIAKPFDLQKGPLIRAALFDEQILVFCAHHIIIDYRSLCVLLEDLQRLYRASVSGKPLEWAVQPASYADYVAWQNHYLASERCQDDFQYWRNQLSGEWPKLELPAARQVSASCQGHCERLKLSIPLSQKLKEFAASRRTTLYVLLLAAFKTLLYRGSGQNDILVGSPTLGRPRREFANSVGYFVNPVALRSHPRGDLRFIDYLIQVNETVLAALEHQDYPFSRLVEQLNPAREAGASFSAWFVLQSGADSASGVAELALGLPGISFDWAGMQVESHALQDFPAQFDIALLMAETSEGLAASFQYRSDVLERAVVLRMKAHFECLLQGILDTPEACLSELAFLTQAERNQLFEWNKTAVSHAEKSSARHLFEQVAAQKPEAIALVFQDQRLSYGDLNRQANRLAHFLWAQGVAPETRIALCLPRCAEWLAGLWAIFKAGCVYVPIDPLYPDDRKAYVMQDAGIQTILTLSELALDWVQDAAVICLDDSAIYQDQNSQNPEVEFSEDQAAYVIYTSGSTGKPKGAVVSHANLMHSTQARQHYYKQPVGCYLLLSSFAFDSSLAGLFWTLCQGGCLCLPEDDLIKDPGGLGALIAKHKVTHLLALPSLYQLLLEHVPTVALKSLNTVIVAGESCPASTAELHRNRLPETLFFNEYGPTEASVWCSVYAPDAASDDAVLSIGKPIANSRIYVADPAMQLLPIGASGELLVGGEGVSRGYLNQPGLTAEKFIPDPFGPYGGRLYKTGDRARFREDGNLDFLGRIDHQVKIRGYRIELGEIEACLLNDPRVKAAAVIVKEDAPGVKRLAAYWAGEADGEALKQHVKARLPDYMLPSNWHRLDSLPLNANGKLDRAALQAIEIQSKFEFVAPRDEAEEAVAGIWREILGVEKLSIHDDFFELGGHSLAGIQVMAKVQELFDIALPVNVLFEAATIAAFVDKMADYQGEIYE